MYRYIKYYDLGYNAGSNLAIKDKLFEIKRKFNNTKIRNTIVRLYILGYIDGYNDTYKKLTLILI